MPFHVPVHFPDPCIKRTLAKGYLGRNAWDPRAMSSTNNQKAFMSFLSLSNHLDRQLLFFFFHPLYPPKKINKNKKR